MLHLKLQRVHLTLPLQIEKFCLYQKCSIRKLAPCAAIECVLRACVWGGDVGVFWRLIIKVEPKFNEDGKRPRRGQEVARERERSGL